MLAVLLIIYAGRDFHPPIKYVTNLGAEDTSLPYLIYTPFNPSRSSEAENKFQKYWVTPLSVPLPTDWHAERWCLSIVFALWNISRRRSCISHINHTYQKEICSHSWQCAKIHDNQWEATRINRNQWTPMKLIEILWKSMKARWSPKRIYEHQRKSNENLWNYNKSKEN